MNISPSLHSASPLDLHVKGPLVQTLLNLAQFHLPKKFSKMRKSQLGLNTDIYSVNLTTKERLKQTSFMEFETREEVSSIVMKYFKIYLFIYFFSIYMILSKI